MPGDDSCGTDHESISGSDKRSIRMGVAGGVTPDVFSGQYTFSSLTIYWSLFSF